MNYLHQIKTGGPQLHPLAVGSIGSHICMRDICVTSSEIRRTWHTQWVFILCAERLYRMMSAASREKPVSISTGRTKRLFFSVVTWTSLDRVRTQMRPDHGGCCVFDFGCVRSGPLGGGAVAHRRPDHSKQHLRYAALLSPCTEYVSIYGHYPSSTSLRKSYATFLS